MVSSEEDQVRPRSLAFAGITDAPKPAEILLEEGDTIAISKTPMSTYLSEERIKFITGERPMDEWDAFVEEYKSMGNVEEVLSVYDNAKQNIYTNIRNYPDFIIND